MALIREYSNFAGLYRWNQQDVYCSRHSADQIYVSAVLVGGGGAGPYGSVDNVKYTGGGGGGLAHFANLGSLREILLVVVGRGGQGPQSYSDTGFNGTAPDGNDTTLTYGTFVATAEGGQVVASTHQAPPPEGSKFS